MHQTMHSSRELESSSFEITVDGREVRLVELFAGFGEHDRLGVVLRRLCARAEVGRDDSQSVGGHPMKEVRPWHR